METMLQELLLLFSITVPPVLLGYLCYLGFALDRQDDRCERPLKPRGDRKHPYHFFHQ